MGSSKKEHPNLNPNKSKKRSVKDLVIKKFDKSSSTVDYSSEFENTSETEDINARPQLRDTELETTILKSKKEEPIIKEEPKSSIKPFDSMKKVTKQTGSEEDSKPKTNPTLDDFMETRPKLNEEKVEIEDENPNDDEIIVEVENENPNDDEILVEAEEEIKEESEELLNEEVKEESKEDAKSSHINPIGSVKDVIKKLEPEHPPAKPTLNPSPNDLKPKESVIKEVIKKTESEVKSASDNTLDSVRGVIKKLDSDSKPTLDPTPNELPKTRQIEEEKSKEEKIEENKEEEVPQEDEKDKITVEIEEYDDSEGSGFKFVSKIINLRIGIFGHKVKIVDIVIVFIGLFLILCGGIASAGVAEKVIDNVVFGERSTVSFLLVIVGILFITSVLGPVLIKRSSLKGFYEQLQSVDAEPKMNTTSKKSDSKHDKKETEEKKDEKEESDKKSKDSYL